MHTGTGRLNLGCVSSAETCGGCGERRVDEGPRPGRPRGTGLCDEDGPVPGTKHQTSEKDHNPQLSFIFFYYNYIHCMCTLSLNLNLDDHAWEQQSILQIQCLLTMKILYVYSHSD